jgi:hypothetical protein
MTKGSRNILSQFRKCDLDLNIRKEGDGRALSSFTTGLQPHVSLVWDNIKCDWNGMRIKCGSSLFAPLESMR